MTIRTNLRTRLLAVLAALALLLPLVLAAPVVPAFAAGATLADFEGGTPGGWFDYAGGGAAVTTGVITVADTDPLARPGQIGDNAFLEAIFDVSAGWGGFGDDFDLTTGVQDWTGAIGVSFWMYGTGSGNTYQFEIFDNGPDADNAERFDTLFTDDFSGWQQIVIPFADFTRATDFQPGGAPNDGLTLTQTWGWAIPLDGNAGALTIDDVRLEAAVVDDFEAGLPSGTDGDGNAIGWVTFSDGASGVSIATTASPPAAVPGAGPSNNVLAVDTNVVGGGFAGFVHAFENPVVDTWVTQDWSSFTGFSFWLYGNNTGSTLFVDILDNRAPGTTGDTAERWSTDIIDDFNGWQLIQIPFASLSRKEIGNGAPNDGLGLTEVHGWAFGVFSSGQQFVNYLDDVTLYGIAEVPELAVSFSVNAFEIDEGATGDITVQLNRPMNADDPAQVSVDYSVETVIAEAGRDYVQPAPGTLTFTNGGPSQMSFPLETLDDDKYEGTERVILRLSNPVDVAPGFIMQAAADIVDNDPYDPLLIDDFEQGIYLWDSSPSVGLANPEIASDGPAALPGQGAYEQVLSATVLTPEHLEIQGRICNKGKGVIPVVLRSTADFDATTVDHRTVRLGDAAEMHVDRDGVAKRHQEGTDLAFHFRFADTGLVCDPEVVPFTGLTFDGEPVTGSLWRNFAAGRDWSASDGLTFWFYGSGSGDEVTVSLKDNRAADPGPSGWELVWSDEFNDPAGTPPNPAHWQHEIGDGTVNGIPGWGNAELQYYTESPANASTDGDGNLVITAREAGGELCYYGPCEYTSARLISAERAEFAYGRIESRIQVPPGEAGLWPAFWSLGTDIGLVGWPQTGEIDIMEYVSRIPTEIFGTVHGPGYSGGASYGNTYDFGGPVSDGYHTYAIEWQPNRIEWYVDGTLYHTAEPGDVAPNEWVFNDPVFLILNLAIGGNFGGAVSDDLTFPQSMAIDYVRVYQGPDTAERWETSFVDDSEGWREITIPFEFFTRSASQPAGAPNDGLGLTDVWGYGFSIADAMATADFHVDQVRLLAPTEVAVTSTGDSGPGSLRSAIDAVANGGTVILDPALAGQTIGLTSPLSIAKSVVIDGSQAPGVTLSAGGVDRVLIVEASGLVAISDVTVADGFGWQLAGCVLNNGSLMLDGVMLTNCTMATDAGDFWQGGGAIYTGAGGSLHMVDSTVSGNNAAWSGGGIYSFFDTTTTITNSTISGNVSGDVGGGLRLLGNATITNSTISGNTSTGWYGGAMFSTDGAVSVINSTIAGNSSPVWAPADVFVGTFGASSASLTMVNTIVDSAQDNCFVAFFGSGVVTLMTDHDNVFTDTTCFVGASDQVVANTGLDVLADNGGPTATHALLPGSPAIDAADPAACPATDQRGVTRDAACDVGSYEYIP